MCLPIIYPRKSTSGFGQKECRGNRLRQRRRLAICEIPKIRTIVERYRDCTEYSDEVLRQFVEKVIVHETVKDEDGERSREIEVYLNFIGKFDVPAQPVELSPEEQKRQEALKKRRIHERNKRVQKRQERMNAQLKNESPI